MVSADARGDGRVAQRTRIRVGDVVDHVAGHEMSSRRRATADEGGAHTRHEIVVDTPPAPQTG